MLLLGVRDSCNGRDLGANIVNHNLEISTLHSTSESSLPITDNPPVVILPVAVEPEESVEASPGWSVVPGAVTQVPL